MLVLLIENDAEAALRIATEVLRAGHAVDRVPSADGAADALAMQEYDLVIMDLGRPSQSALKALRCIRAASAHTPIMTLSAEDDSNDRVACLNIGADDSISEPFDMDELIARARALTRRRYGLRSDVMRYGKLEFDRASKTVSLNGYPISLTPKESSTLEVLVAHNGKAVHKERIHQTLYGFDRCEVGLGAVETYVARLRKKLGAASISIRTVHHFGYQLCLQEQRERK